MAIRISPGDLKSAARLTSRIGEIGEVTRDNPWKGTYRISIESGRARLGLTDGTLTLEWAMPIEGSDLDGLDESIASAGFDALAVHLADGHPCEITSDDGLVIACSGSSPSRPERVTSRLRLPGRAGPAFPPRALSAGPDDPGRPSRRWTAPARPLSRALAFVAPFIGTKNPVESRSVATWTTEGVLVGGSPMKAALVSGLPPSLIPLSFSRRTALATAAFLEQVRGDVEVRAVGAYYSFTSAMDGHVLELRGEPAPFPMQFLGLDDTPLESCRIDRKAFLNSLAILEVFLPSRGDNLEFRIRGEGENAAIRITTPGSPATLSSDEIPIIRDLPHRASQPGRAPVAAVERTSETLFWAKGRVLQQVLNGMGAVTMTCDLDPRNLRLRLAEVPRTGEMVRSVHLRVLMPREEVERERPSSGSEEDQAAGPDCERQTAVAVDDPLNVSPEQNGESGRGHRLAARIS